MCYVRKRKRNILSMLATALPKLKGNHITFLCVTLFFFLARCNAIATLSGEKRDKIDMKSSKKDIHFNKVGL